MKSPWPDAHHHDILALARAMDTSTAVDAMRLQLPAAQWQTLGGYLQALSLSAGEVLMKCSAQDRTVFFVESGHLTAHREDEQGSIRMALLGAGSVVGEGSFFSQEPRRATVQATSACRLWRLTPLRFQELSNRHPDLALALSLAMGAVLARRLTLSARRVAVT